MEEKVFEKCENRLVKVLFHDGSNVRSLKGELKSSSEGFIVLETLDNRFLINLSEVIKIQTTKN